MKAKYKYGNTIDRPRKEFRAGIGTLAFSKLVSRSDISKHPWLQSLVGYLKVRFAIAHQDFGSLVTSIEQTARATAIAKANRVDASMSFPPNQSTIHVDDYTPDVAAWAPEVFAAALIVLLASGKDVLPVIEDWKSSATDAKSNFNYGELLNQAAELLSSDPRSAYRAYSTRPSTRFQSLIGALRIASDPETPLESCFVGLATLVTDEPLIEGLIDVRDALGALTKRVWEQRIRFPVEFNSPRVSIPAIRAACEAPHKGLRLAAQILLAAQSAVSVRALDSSLQKLRRLTDETP